MEIELHRLCFSNYPTGKVIFMNDRNFLLTILKLSPPLIKTALVSLSAERVEARIAPISSEIHAEVDTT